MKRRTAMSMVLAYPVLGLSATDLWGRVPRDTVSAALEAAMPPMENPEDPGFDVFERLSQIVCLNPSLDKTTAARIFGLIKVEPWGLHHVGAVYGKLLAHLSEDGTPRPLSDLIDEGHLSDGEAWFVSHLLTTWYLGIYYHESQPEPVRVSFETSLMWAALDGYLDPPGFSGAQPGDWTAPPPAALALSGSGDNAESGTE